MQVGNNLIQIDCNIYILQPTCVKLLSTWQHLIEIRIYISRSCLNSKIDSGFIVDFTTNISIFFIDQ